MVNLILASPWLQYVNYFCLPLPKNLVTLTERFQKWCLWPCEVEIAPEYSQNHPLHTTGRHLLPWSRFLKMSLREKWQSSLHLYFPEGQTNGTVVGCKDQDTTVPEEFIMDYYRTWHPSQYQNCRFYQKCYYVDIYLHKGGRTEQAK